MLSKRLIACLDVRNGCVVKGVQFEGLRNAGDPAALARRYNVEGIDELVILDVNATLESRQALAETIRAVSRELFIPLAVGGGIRSLDDAEAAIKRGRTRSASTVRRSSILSSSPGWLPATAARPSSSRSTPSGRTGVSTSTREAAAR